MRKFVLFGLAALILFASGAHAVTRKAFVIFAGAATDTTASGMADSSAVFPTGDLERLYLYLHPSVACRVAIQIRSHGDSLAGSGAPALTDSSKAYIWAWRAFNVAGTTDTLTYRPANNGVLTSAVVPDFTELVFTFLGNQGSVKWGRTNGIMIPLRGSDGEWYWGPNTSVRLRVLEAPGAVTWRASLQGVSFGR